MSARPRIQTEPLRISAEEEPGWHIGPQDRFDFTWLVLFILIGFGVWKVAS